MSHRLVIVFCLLMAVPVISSAQIGWVDRSNANTRLLVDMEAQFVPENASGNGLTEYDGLAMDLGPDLSARTVAAAEALLEKYRQLLADERDDRIRQDIEILMTSLQQEIEGQQLRQKYLLDWNDVPSTVYQTISMLLADQVEPQRRAKALELLQRYVGMYPDSSVLTEQAKAIFEASFGPGKVGPYRAEVEQAISKIPVFVGGIRDLFEKYEISDAQAALDEMERQFLEYGQWEESHVLPKTRSEFRQPPELYAFSLRSSGIDIDPLELIDRAQLEFAETRSAMAMLAPRVAESLDIKTDNYREVIRALKQQTIPDDQIESAYAEVMEKLEQIIRNEDIVSLPDYSVMMRLASPAESAAIPAPHMQPAPLIGNTGEQGQFILPVSVPGTAAEMVIDDFNFAAASWTLSAHEARPGHELQFATMIDLGVSQARALYAFNSVNVEGWALYAEAEMMPYEPIEGQLIAYQHRLLRAARAFLDPMLNLGLIEVEEAGRLLSEEVVVSAAMVKQELDRYTFRSPGQAPSYYYGYSQLLALRVKTEIALGERFNRKAFNDFLLSQGLLPPDLLAKAVCEKFIPEQK